MLLGGDTATHIARFLEVSQGLHEGVLPAWTNYQFLGSSLLGFTGPLTYVVGGVVNFFVGDASETAKLLLFVLHIAAGWICFDFLMVIGLSRFGAIFGALGFSSAFAILHLFLFRGVFPQAFTLCFFVAVYSSAERLMTRERMSWNSWLVFCLATAGLVINHQPHALFVAVYLALFGISSLLLGRWHAAALPRVITAGVLGAVISTVAVLPVLAEASWAMIEPEGAIARLRVPTLHRLFDLIAWKNTRTTWGTDYWAYLGIVMVVFAAVGLWVALPERARTARSKLVIALLPGFILGFFLGNDVVRDVMFIMFNVAIFAAIGVEAACARRANWGRFGGAVLLLLLLDLSSTAIQPVARNDKHYMIDAGHYLAERAPNERIVQMGLDDAGVLDGDMGPDAGPLSYETMVQRVAGHHNMAATLVHNFAASIVKQTQNDLQASGVLTPTTRGLLATLNVSRVICFSSTRAGCPDTFATAQLDGPLGRVVPIPEATPVLFSQRLVSIPPQEKLAKPMDWDDAFMPGEQRGERLKSATAAYLSLMSPNFQTRHAGAIPVLTGDMSLGSETGWQTKLDYYRVSLEHVDLQVTVSSPGYVQIANAYFPGNAVRLNGAVVTPTETALHLIAVPLPAGTSLIEIAPIITPIRLISLLISLGGLLAALAVFAIGQHRARHP